MVILMITLASHKVLSVDILWQGVTVYIIWQLMTTGGLYGCFMRIVPPHFPQKVGSCQKAKMEQRISELLFSGACCDSVLRLHPALVAVWATKKSLGFEWPKSFWYQQYKNCRLLPRRKFVKEVHSNWHLHMFWIRTGNFDKKSRKQQHRKVTILSNKGLDVSLRWHCGKSGINRDKMCLFNYHDRVSIGRFRQPSFYLPCIRWDRVFQPSFRCTDLVTGICRKKSEGTAPGEFGAQKNFETHLIDFSSFLPNKMETTHETTQHSKHLESETFASC